MNQVSTLPAQEECGFCKRIAKDTVFPIQEEDLHWKFEVPLSKAVSLNAYERHRESSTTH